LLLKDINGIFPEEEMARAQKWSRIFIWAEQYRTPLDTSLRSACSCQLSVPSVSGLARVLTQNTSCCALCIAARRCDLKQRGGEVSVLKLNSIIILR
jgi:hypothetical protein